VGYINQQSGKDLTKVFDQYLRYTTLPTLEVRFQKGKAECRWDADVKGFNMPVRVRTKGGTYRFITPTTEWQPLNVPKVTKENLEVDTFDYYIKVVVL